MALRIITPLSFPKSVQASRSITTSASAPAASHSAVPPVPGISPVVSFRPLNHRRVMADGRLRGDFYSGTGLVSAFPLCFAAAGTGGTSQDQSPSLEGGIESGEDGKVVKKAVPSLPDRDFSGTPYVPVYVMLPVNYILKLHGYIFDFFSG